MPESERRYKTVLPEGNFPERLHDEAYVADEMFRQIAEQRVSYPNSASDAKPITVGAYVVAFRGNARSFFLVQDVMEGGNLAAVEKGKDAVERLCVACVMSGADELVVGSEAFHVRLIEGHTLEDVLRWRAEHGGTLEDYPGAQEVVQVQLFRTEGDWAARAAILREEGKPPRLDAWKAEKQEGIAPGRFSAIYAKAQAAKAQDS